VPTTTKVVSSNPIHGEVYPIQIYVIKLVSDLRVSSTNKTDRNLQLPVQSVPTTSKVVSSNPIHGEVYPIQIYVIKLVSDLRFSPGTPVYSTNKTDRNDITEILLKVALNTVSNKKLLSLSLSVKSVYN
jgi:hypothetical protein